MKKRQLQVSYDEASSSDSSSSSSSSDSDDFSDKELDELPNVGNDKVEHDKEESDDDSTSASDDEDDESKSHDDPDQLIQNSKMHRNEEGDDEEDEEEQDDIELPLQERLQRQEKAGRAMQLKTQRERKRNALQIASERLSHIKQSSSSQRTNKRKIGMDENGEEDDDDKDDDSDTHMDHHDNTASKRKRSKHAPTEASSKRSDFFRRGFRLNESGLGIEIGARRYKPLDPRMSSLRGHLNEEQFEKNYEFLQEMRNNEIATLKKQIAARKEVGKKGQRMRRKMGVSLSGGSLQQDEERLKQLKQEKADFERRKIERAAKQAVKKKIQTEVEEGKRGAFYLKRKEKKKLEFEAKLEELRKRGGHHAVEKALAKKRKKAKSRDASKFAK